MNNSQKSAFGLYAHKWVVTVTYTIEAHIYTAGRGAINFQDSNYCPVNVSQQEKMDVTGDNYIPRLCLGI